MVYMQVHLMLNLKIKIIKMILLKLLMEDLIFNLKIKLV